MGSSGARAREFDDLLRPRTLICLRRDSPGLRGLADSSSAPAAQSGCSCERIGDVGCARRHVNIGETDNERFCDSPDRSPAVLQCVGD
jgi:hypothetical protein